MRTVAIVLVLVGCSASDEAEKLGRLAKTVNESLRELRPTANAMLNGAQLSDRELITLCTSADVALRSIATQRKMFEEADYEHPKTLDRAPFAANRLVEQRDTYCANDAGARCRTFCLEAWNMLNDSVEKLRERARRHDVRIESLVDYK